MVVVGEASELVGSRGRRAHHLERADVGRAHALCRCRHCRVTPWRAAPGERADRAADGHAVGGGGGRGQRHALRRAPSSTSSSAIGGCSTGRVDAALARWRTAWSSSCLPAVATQPEPGADVVVAGGATRSASVRAGLAAVPAQADVVVVHDAARPLAPLTLFEAVVAAVAAGADGAVPGVPLTDTVKRVDGERRDRNPRPFRRWSRSQTPQAFAASTLRAAHAVGHRRHRRCRAGRSGRWPSGRRARRRREHEADDPARPRARARSRRRARGSRS